MPVGGDTWNEMADFRAQRRQCTVCPDTLAPSPAWDVSSSRFPDCAAFQQTSRPRGVQLPQARRTPRRLPVLLPPRPPFSASLPPPQACEFFVLELTQRSWNVAEEQKRRTIQINDLSTAIARTEIFDFLMDVVPDPDKAAWSDSGGGCADPNGSCSPAAPPPGPTHTPPSPPLAGSRSPLAFSNSHAALHKAAAGAPAVPGYALPLGVSGGQHSYLGQDPGTGNGRTSGSLHVGLAPAMQTGMHALAHAAPQDYVGRGGGW